MPNITIGVIGGGSLFTPELVELLALNADVTGSVEVRLMDIDKNRQQIVGDFCERIASAIGSSSSVWISRLIGLAPYSLL